MTLIAAISAGLLCGSSAFWAGHRIGWYRGYNARKYETHDGEHLV